MTGEWIGPVLDKLIVVLALGWAVTLTWVSLRRRPDLARPTVPPSLDLTDVLLLVGSKEAQLVVLRRELADLQARAETDRVGANQGLAESQR